MPSESLLLSGDSADLVTVEHAVPHRSTVPCIAGEGVAIPLRQKRLARGEPGPPVLMVHGGISPSTLAFDLPHESYSWMAALARAGFDVYAMDMTGYGRAVRPMMEDPHNLPPETRARLGFHASAPVPYPFELVNSQSEWDEIDRVVDFIRARRGVPKISLVGWSGGG